MDPIYHLIQGTLPGSLTSSVNSSYYNQSDSDNLIHGADGHSLHLEENLSSLTWSSTFGRVRQQPPCSPVYGYSAITYLLPQWLPVMPGTHPVPPPWALAVGPFQCQSQGDGV